MKEKIDDILQEVTEIAMEKTDGMVGFFGLLEEVKKGKKGSKASKEIYKKLRDVTDEEYEVYGLVEMLKDNMKRAMAEEAQNKQKEEPTSDDSPF